MLLTPKVANSFIYVVNHHMAKCVYIIWGPHFLLDKRKLESVQRRATKLIPHLSDKLYQHHTI